MRKNNRFVWRPSSMSAQIGRHWIGLCDFLIGQIIAMGNSSSSLKSRKCTSLPSSPDVKRYSSKSSSRQNKVQRNSAVCDSFCFAARHLQRNYYEVEIELRQPFGVGRAECFRRKQVVFINISFHVFLFRLNSYRQKQLPVLYGKSSVNGGATSIPLPQSVSVTRRCPPDKIRPLPPTPDQSHSKFRVTSSLSAPGRCYVSR